MKLSNTCDRYRHSGPWFFVNWRVTAIFPALLLFSLVCGCSHKGEVVDLIEKNYKNLSKGGNIKFVSYKESHTTNWKVRSFHAEGKVKWEKPWYFVSRTFTASHDIPVIMIADECKEMNAGIPFESSFYKGRTDKKGQISLSLPKMEYMTAKELVEKFPDACIVMPSGKMVGRKIDESRLNKNSKEAVRQGESVAKAMEACAKKIGPSVSKCLGVVFRKMNNDELKSYEQECKALSAEVKRSKEGLNDIRRTLEYYRDFPVEKLRRKFAGECLAMIEKSEKSVSQLEQSLDERVEAIKNEMEARGSDGVIFLNSKTKVGKNTPRAVADKKRVTENESAPRSSAGEVRTIRMGVGEVKVIDLNQSEKLSLPKP